MKKLFFYYCFFLISVIQPFTSSSQTLIMNEVSNGPAGNQEYVEFIVIDTVINYNCNSLTPPCIDIRGWIFDDNSGYHGTSGIAGGAVRFSFDPLWACVPLGTIIVIYNNLDPNPSMPANDLSLSDGNCSIIVPINNTLLFERNTTTPGAVACSYPATGWIAGGSWTTTLLANPGDCARIVNLAGCEVFSVCWAAANLNTLIYFASGGSGAQNVWYFNNGNPASQVNWTQGSTTPAGGSQTPGLPNNALNAAYIAQFNNGCTTITPIIVSATSINAGCTCNGTATATASGSIPGYTYEWYTSAFVPIGQIGSTASGLCAGIYNVIATSSIGCTDTASVTITAPLSATVTVNNATICFGSSTTLTATPLNSGGTYSWSPGGQTTQTITISPAITTTYTVTYTLGACVATNTGVVTVNVLPIIAVPDQTVCIGTAVTLSGNGANTYTWTGGITDGVPFNPLTTTTYTVTGTITATGCINTDPATITVNPLPTVGAGIDQTVCAGVAVTLSGSGASTYTWNNGVTNGVAFTPLATTTFTVTGTSAAGCINTDQVIVTVNPIPIVNAGVDQTVCAGTAVTLNGSGAASYTWNNGITNGVAFTPIATTTYTVTGTSAAGCTNTDQAVVTVNPLPIINAGLDVSICIGATTILTASGGVTYSWNNGLGVGNNFSVSPLVTTTYTVVGTDAAGCTGTDAMTVTVNPLPTVGAGVDQTVCAGVAVTLSGSGASTYTWNNGVTNGVAFTPLATTTYTVTGTSAAGCINTDQVIVTVNPIPVVSAGPDVSICVGGSITLTATGATTYSWAPGGQLTAAITVTPAATTTYTVTGTSLGCTASDATTVTVLANAPINAGLDAAICIGASTTLSATGGLTYSWNNGLGVGNNFSVSPLVTTTYTVVGTNAAGCTGTDAMTVTVNPLPTVGAGADQTVCAGVAVTLFGSGASTYTWDNSVTNGVAFTPLATTTYTVTGTSAVGCINTDQVIVTVNPIPIVNAGVDQTVCAGTAVTLTGSGAASYTWNNGITNGVAFTPIATTTYTVTGTSAAGCTSTDQAVVTVNPLPIVNAGLDVSICIGASTTLSATGGVTYSWNNGLGVGNNFSVSPLVATTYTVVGTDAAGCTGTDAMTVTVNPLPTVGAGVDQTICEGVAVTLSGSGAATYTWNNSVTNGIAFTPLATTTYTVTGTSAAGCINTNQVVVTVNPLPLVNAGVDQTVCAGTAVTLNGSGATSYTWSGGVTNGVAFIPLATATYTVTGTSAAGCINTDQVIVTVNPLPIVNAGVDQTVCSGTAVTLSGAGASTYTWDNSVNNGVAFTPVVGTITYTVTGTSAAGCIATDQVLVTVNPNPAPVINGPSTYCTGTFALLSTSAPFTSYLWSTTATTSTINATIANNPISVTVTNTFGCTGTSPVFPISESNVITANFDVTICQGQSSVIHGVAQTVAGVYSQTYALGSGCDSTSNVTLNVNPLPVVAAGADQTVCTGVATTLTATGAATYTWDNGITNGVPFTQVIGSITYTVSGTSAAGCVNTDQVVVLVNPLPIVGAGLDQAVCAGIAVTLSGSGAATYTWNNAVTNAVAFTPVVTNTYTVIGTDVNGCVNTDQAIVTVNPIPVVSAGADASICIGGSATLTATGASTYSWAPGGQLTAAITVAPITTTTYTVTGTSVAGCTSTDQVTVTVNPLPIVSAGIDQAVCIGTSVTLSGSGASTYTWNNNVTNGLAFTPIVGSVTYTVTGTSAAGCVNTDQVIVLVNPLPIVGAGLDQAVCAGIAVTLSGSGASTYTWNNAVTNAVAFTPVITNTYTVTGTDVNGCVNTDQVIVTVNPIPVVSAGPDASICIGASVTLFGGGASTYTWDNGVTNGVSFAPITTTTYTVTGTSVAGCTSTDQVTVTVNPLPIVSAGIDQAVCIGTSVTLSGSGASTYTWNNNVTNGLAFTPIVGSVTYTVSGTSAAGCVNTDQVIVLVNPLPIVGAGLDQAVCAGDQVILSGSGASTYTWNNGITDGVIFTPPATTTYTVTGTSAAGCINTDQVVVTVNPIPTVFAGNDIVLCEDETATLTGSGANTYSWGNNVTNGVAFTPSVGTGTYTVTGTTTAGCVDSDQIDVLVAPITPVSFISDLTYGCAPLTVTFTNTTMGASNYIWTMSDGTVITGSETVVNTFEESGCYDISLSITNSNGCQSSFSAFDLVCVEEIPTADFSQSSFTVSEFNPTVIFDNNSIGASSYIWDFGDGSTTDQVNPSHEYAVDDLGSYLVTLVAISPFGCADTAFSTIQILEELIYYVPNTFTPDNDNFNPTFQPIFTSGFDPYDYTLLIFNRWGELIFESHNTEIGWDGSYGSNGEVVLVQDGVFTWKIEFKTNRNDERKMVVGHVNILR